MVNRLGTKWRRLWSLVALLCAVFPANTLAEDIQVTAEINPTTFTVGESARFVITVKGAGSAEPETPNVEGLNFGYPARSHSKQMVFQGLAAKDVFVETTISFAFMVQADKAADYSIGPVKINADGKTYTTHPVDCTVLPARSSGQGRVSGVNPATDGIKSIGFLRIIPETERMYSGQLVPFLVKFYITPGMEEAEKKYLSLKLVGDNFVQHFLNKQGQKKEELVNGQVFTTVTWQGALVAAKEGIFPLIVEMDVLVQVSSRSRPFRNIFDSFLVDLSDSVREIKLSSQEKELTVLDLPVENRPKDFSGAIGTFSLAVEASPLDGKVGDPITVKMQLEGTGNFSLVEAPILSEQKGWKIYPASGTVQDLGTGKGIKTFEQPFIPMDQGVTAVPPMRFSYFDPQTEKYVTLNSDPIPLSLQSAPDQPAGQLTPQAETNQASAAAPPVKLDQQQDNRDVSEGTFTSPSVQHLAPLHPELGKLIPSIQPLYQKLWFQVLMFFAAFSLLIALILYLKQRRLAKDPSILRRKKVQGRLATHYEEMNKALAIPDQEAFQQHCRAAIQQQTGEVWGLAPESVTLADLEQHLPIGAPLRDVFTRLEQSGYAGEQLNQDELQEILQTTRNELDKLA